MTHQSSYLAHYGVPGMKWGVRNYQNVDGTYTQAGLARYNRGTAQVRFQNPGGSNLAPTTPRVQIRRSNNNGARTNQVTSTPKKAVKTNESPKKVQARKARARKIIAVAAGTAVAAALGYAAYKGSTKLRDNMREDIMKNMSKGHESINSFGSKYWDSADRHKYNEMTKERAKFMSDNFTRRDAVVAKLQEKTGVRLNLPQSRAKVLAQRRSEQKVSNFFHEAEKRGEMNKSIHDARVELKNAQRKLSTYKATQHIGNSKRYEQLWTEKYQSNVDMYKKRLDDLLLLRRSA